MEPVKGIKRMKKLNVGIVAARRPNLLRTTLQSFDEHLFNRCEVDQVRVNLDPIFGSKGDETKTISLIREFFPSAEINTPCKPNFTKAVQWIWSGINDGPFLHLEDDWICLHDIPIEEIFSTLNNSAKMILLLSETHGERGKQRVSVRVKKHKILGLTYKRTPIPTFGTSPSIIDGAFARVAATLFDLKLDPEKQMRDNRNQELIKFLSQHQCLFQSSPVGSPLIEDLGRAWHKEQNVEKIVEEGVSKWVIGTKTD